MSENMATSHRTHLFFLYWTGKTRPLETSWMLRDVTIWPPPLVPNSVSVPFALDVPSLPPSNDLTSKERRWEGGREMMERRWHKVVPVLWCASTSEPKTSLWWWRHSFFPHFTLTQSSFLLHQQIAWVSYPQTQKALKHNEFIWTEVWETWKSYFSSNVLFLHSSVFPSEGRASDMKFASQSLHIITPDIFSVSKPNMTFFFFCFLVTGLDDMIQGRVLFAFNKNQDNRVLSFGFSHNKDGNQPFFFFCHFLIQQQQHECLSFTDIFCLNQRQI